ncbi:glutathione synthase/ribosomal protein S6 modification enzyme [Mycolicibacterium monacense DSM 44395]|nr:glutathione synthase/ribosomal protein S6 modification enzyme [Mycolicibacterium monacense DSM 44395]
MTRVRLARPDLFHPRIVLAGCPALPEGDGDDDGLVDALRTRGLHARWLAWDDPAVLDADLVILRATWDYIDRLDEFKVWTRQGRNLLNSPDVVAWNTDKRYLVELAQRGVPTVPTRHFGSGDRVVVPDGEVVVKPAVGGGSVGAQRFTDPAAAAAHAAHLQAQGRAVLVQPYDARVEYGETALVFLGSAQSHAFTKAAILPPEGPPVFDVSGTYALETLAPAEPDFELWELGHAALGAAAAALGMEAAEFLYARVDVIGDREDARVLEVELVEPSLGWRQLDAATRADRERDFAIAVEVALERLGLGPLSHRRP